MYNFLILTMSSLSCSDLPACLACVVQYFAGQFSNRTGGAGRGARTCFGPAAVVRGVLEAGARD